jgi:hypothetical protein
MDPLFTSLATATAKATTSEIYSKVKAVKTNKNKDQVIGELTSIINELIDSRETLLSIAQDLKGKLIAQQISDNDIKYIIDTIIPMLENILHSEGEKEEEGEEKGVEKETIDQIKSILSEETLKILQTLGFNYRQAIGEPLTQIVRAWVLSKTDADNRKLELEILKTQSYNTSLELAEKDDYLDRLKEVRETYKTFHS